MRFSLKNNIAGFIRSQYPQWVFGYKIEEKASKGDFGRKSTGSTAAKRCRELEETGIVRKQIEDGYVKYQYVLVEVPKEEVKQLFTYKVNEPVWRDVK